MKYNDPLFPEVDNPVVMVIAPLLPPIAVEPDPKNIAPDDDVVDVPVLRIRTPLAPELPALAV